jgi:hypothetical protein
MLKVPGLNWNLDGAIGTPSISIVSALVRCAESEDGSCGVPVGVGAGPKYLDRNKRRHGLAA